MMATAEIRTIRIENSEGSAASAKLHFTVFTSNDRLKRAGKALLIFWGIAVATVFIPIAHFFLVPTFLIGGVVMAIANYRARESIEKVSGTCPTCHQEIVIPLESDVKFPLWTYCSAADDPIQLLDDPAVSMSGKAGK